MARKFLSILLGYAFFVGASLLFFKISGYKPHSDPTTVMVIMTALFGVVIALIAGLLTKLIAHVANLKMNYILAVVMAAFATFSFFKSTGNHWTQLLAIFLFSPVSILGTLFIGKPEKLS